MEAQRPALGRLVAATELMKGHRELVHQSTQNWIDVVQDNLRAERAPLDDILRAIGALETRLAGRLDGIDQHLATVDERLATMDEHLATIERRSFAVSTNNIVRAINQKADVRGDRLTALVCEIDAGEFRIGEPIPLFPHTLPDCRILQSDVRRLILSALNVQHHQFPDDFLEFILASAIGLRSSS